MPREDGHELPSRSEAGCLGGAARQAESLDRRPVARRQTQVGAAGAPAETHEVAGA